LAGSRFPLSDIWLAAVTRAKTPEQISSYSSQSEDAPIFASNGDLLFRASEESANFLYRLPHRAYEDSVWQQEAGPTVFAPFEETSNYFGVAREVWMVNFRVRDLDKIAAQLQAAGIAVKD